MILMIVNRLHEFGEVTYSVVMDCANPQAIEKAMNIISVKLINSFRPKISLSLARMTRKPVIIVSSPRQLLEGLITGISKQIRCYDPATFVKSI